MKVLMLGWELPPYNSGGLGVACYHLCEALSKYDIAIEFMLPYRAEHNIDFMAVTAAIPGNVKSIEFASSAYDSYRYTLENGHTEYHDIVSRQRMFELAVEQAVESRSFDIIHAHDWLTFRAAIRAKEKLGCPLVVHVHSIESDRAGGKPGNPLVYEIEAMAFQMADRVIAVSDFTRRAIAHDYHIPLEAIEVIHNSINPYSLGIADPRPDSTYRYLAALQEQGYRVVASVGRLTVQKGLVNFLHAAKKVLDYEPKTMFLIVGDGEQYIELIELAADLGIAANVLFTGFQRGKPWRDAFAIADLFVMPSVSEPFGLVPLEAAGYGTPSLVSKQSGVSEVLYNSLKVDFWDIDEMANKIIAVVHNDTLRDELQENATAEVQSMSWSKAADQCLALYNRYTQKAAIA